jgi:hypothetical protein
MIHVSLQQEGAMASKQQLTTLLKRLQEDFESSIDASQQHIWNTQQIRKLLQSIDFLIPVLQPRQLTSNDIISFLIKHSYLSKVKFKTPRTETLYYWRKINEYELMPVLRPNGYYSHLSALYFHGLLGQEPKNIYFNHEQPARFPLRTNLEQARIDNAFQRQQRLTTARTLYDGKEYWLLNGKQTGNCGVISISTQDGIEVPIAGLERTLIDITVRPAYAGGVKSVLNAYRQAQPKISVERLKTTLYSLDYVYPYHQCIGFYIEMTGNYSKRAVQEFLSFKTLEYDFYLDYAIKEPLYSQKWRLYYPQTLN